MNRYFEFKSVELVHIGSGAAEILAVSHFDLEYKDDNDVHRTIDLQECARIYSCVNSAGKFPPSEDLDWGSLVDATPGFFSMRVTFQPVVGLRAALDEPPWFQFLNRRRTQFAFKDYDHIKRALLEPLAANGWNSWDAC